MNEIWKGQGRLAPGRTASYLVTKTLFPMWLRRDKGGARANTGRSTQDLRSGPSTCVEVIRGEARTTRRSSGRRRPKWPFTPAPRLSRLLRAGCGLALAAMPLGDAQAGRLPKPVSVRLSPFVVPPAQERTPCEYLALSNRRAMHVQAFEVRAPAGLHHVLLYAYFGDDEDPSHLTHGVRDGLACFSVGPPDLDAHSMGLLGAVSGGRYRLPPGYAVSIRPRQPVKVSTHVLNLSPTEALRASVHLRIVPARAGSVRHHLEPIDVLDLWFELPPRKTTVHETEFIAPFDMSVAMLSSHQHRQGRGVAVRAIVGGIDMGLVYENVQWDHPPLNWLDPPLRLRAGDRLRVTCEWYNDSDVVLRYGGSANDEMCNLNGYFFREPEVPREQRRGIRGVLWPVVEPPQS